jgi:hypothetical protein
MNRRRFHYVAGVGAMSSLPLFGRDRAALALDPEPSGVGAAGAGLSQEAAATFATDELQLMYKNAVRLPRPKADCPLPESETLRITYTGRQRDYANVTGADTFMTAWTAEGDLYSTYADGFVLDSKGARADAICTLHPNDWYMRRLGWCVDPFHPGSLTDLPKFEPVSRPGKVTHTGNAMISGDDPFDLRITATPPTPLTHQLYPALYPSGCLIKDGLWISAGHYRGWLLDEANRQLCYEQGPNRFRFSTDAGKTWRWSNFDDRNPVIPERGRPAGGAPIKLGTAKFVDFGQENEHSPDGLAYLVGHGAVDLNGTSNWSSGDAFFLARVAPTMEGLNDPAAFEYFSGRDATGAPKWSQQVADMRPVVEWPCRCGITSITYFPRLKKYVAVICVGWPDGVDGQYDTWIAEAEQLWGPWSRVVYWDAFANQAYFAQIPSKFIQPNGRFYLFYTGGWQGVKPLPPDWQKTPALPHLPAATYSLCVAEFAIESISTEPPAREP